MITHYGLFWSKADVFWGKQGGEAGTLQGRPKQGTDAAETPEEFGSYIGVYCLYHDRTLLYVGQAGIKGKRCLLARLKEHRKDDRFSQWNKFSWFGREGNKEGNKKKGKNKKALSQLEAIAIENNKKALSQMEAIAIEIINPLFNTHRGSFCKAKQVLQVPHEEAEGDMYTKIARIERRLFEKEKNRNKRRNMIID